MAIRAFVFDAYGTLFDVRSVTARCEELFPKKGAALNTIWRTKQLEYSWLRTLMGQYADFWQITGNALKFALAGLNLEYTREQFQYLLESYLHLAPYEDTAVALEKLSRYRKAILSNGTPSMLETVVQNANLTEYFEQLLSVDEVKNYKPQPSVYELAPAKLGLAKSSIAFVSANGWDVAGAKNFGFYVFWLNRLNAPLEELGVKPDATIQTLTQLGDFLF